MHTSTYMQVDALLADAMDKRSVGCTQLNEHSSRSHMVFMLKIEGNNSTTGGFASVWGADDPTWRPRRVCVRALEGRACAHSRGGRVRVRACGMCAMKQGGGACAYISTRCVEPDEPPPFTRLHACVHTRVLHANPSAARSARSNLLAVGASMHHTHTHTHTHCRPVHQRHAESDRSGWI